MPGMKKVPAGVHRYSLGKERPPIWYEIWYEMEEERVLLGRSERTGRHLEHRFYSVTGEYPQRFTGWVSGVIWLLDLYKKNQPPSPVAMSIGAFITSVQENT